MVYPVEMKLLVDQNLCGRVKVIYEGLPTTKIWWPNLDMATVKIKDVLVETQHPLEEVNLHTNDQDLHILVVFCLLI